MASNTRSTKPELQKIDYVQAKARIDAVIRTASIAVERLGLRDKAQPHGSTFKLHCNGAAHLHGNRSSSLTVKMGDGAVSVECWVCSWHGSFVDLAGIAHLDKKPHETSGPAFWECLDVAAKVAGVILDDLKTKRGRPRKVLPEEVRDQLY